jgi:predicted nucleic acid-binding protein
MKLVVDANIFISALIGGKAAELLFDPNFDLLTTERTTWEVKKYLIQNRRRHGTCQVPQC